MKKVKEYMTTSVECCQPHDMIYEVSRKMQEEGIGAIPVCANDKLVGMITDRDLVVRGLAEKRAGSENVTQVMSEELCSIGPEDSIKKAVYVMANKQVRRLPVVVENEELVGIVSLGDMVEDEMLKDEVNHALACISA